MTTKYIQRTVESISSMRARIAVERYDANAPRDYSPFMIGQYLIRRLPLRYTPYTKYVIVAGADVLGDQISHPCLEDCAMLQRKFNAEHGRSEKHPRKSAKITDQTVRGRIVEMLRIKEMDLQALAVMMNRPATLLSPILASLAQEKYIQRRGTKHRYTYRVTA